MNKANVSSFQSVAQYIEEYCQFSGRSINKVKSKIIPSAKCSADFISLLLCLELPTPKVFGNTMVSLFLISVLDPNTSFIF